MKAKDLKTDGTEYALVVNKVKHDEGIQCYARVVIKETQKHLPGFREPTGAVVEFVADPDADMWSNGETEIKQRPTQKPHREKRQLVDAKWIPGTWNEVFAEIRKRMTARAYDRARHQAILEAKDERLKTANQLAQVWGQTYAQETTYAVEQAVGNIVRIIGGENDGKTMEVVGYATARLGQYNRYTKPNARQTLAYLDEDGDMREHHLMAGEDFEIVPDQIDTTELEASYQNEIQALEARYGEIPEEDKITT